MAEGIKAEVVQAEGAQAEMFGFSISGLRPSA